MAADLRAAEIRLATSLATARRPAATQLHRSSLAMDENSKVLVVTPTLGESGFLDETVAQVGSVGVPVLHVISAPANRIKPLAARFPHARITADAGKAGGIYGALNAAPRGLPRRVGMVHLHQR